MKSQEKSTLGSYRIQNMPDKRLQAKLVYSNKLINNQLLKILLVNETNFHHFKFESLAFVVLNFLIQFVYNSLWVDMLAFF